MNLLLNRSLLFLVTGLFALTSLRGELVASAQTPAIPLDGVEQPDAFESKQAVNLSKQAIDDAVEKAVDWLLDFCLTQRKISASNGNDGAKNTIVLFQTAYLLEVMPDLFREDPRREKLLTKANQNLSSEAWNSVSSLTSWVNGFATLCVSEKMARGKNLQPTLKRLAESWVDRQNREGGWSHGGAGRLVDFYPSTILGASNFALITLGSIKEFENPYRDSIDYEDVVDDALAMYAGAQSSRGGLPYGARSYQKSVQSSRTATSLIGMAALGQTQTEMFRKAARYSVNNIETVPFGHASVPMHIGCGGLAFAMLGGDYWSQYRKLHFPKILKVKRDDGSFGDFSDNGSGVSLGSIEIETAYRTALYTICLTADKSEFVKRLHRQTNVAQVFTGTKDRQTSTKIFGSTPKAAFKFELQPKQALLGFDSSKDKAFPLVFDRRSKLIYRFDNSASDPLVPINVERKLKRSDQFWITENQILVISNLERVDTVEPSGQIGGGPARAKADSDSDSNSKLQAGRPVSCFDISTGKLLWKRKLPLYREKHFREQSVDLGAVNGKWLRRFDLQTGELLFETTAVGEVTSAPVFGLDLGPSYVGGIGRLAKYDQAGNNQWTAKMRGKRGRIQPAALSIVSINQQVFVSTANAHIFCYDSTDGSLNWKLETQGTVKLVTNEAGQLFAVGSDGVIQEVALDVTEQQFLWASDIGGGREVRSGSESKSNDLSCFTTAKKLIVLDRIRNLATVINSHTGEQEFQLEAQQAYLSGKRLMIKHNSTVLVYDLQ